MAVRGKLRQSIHHARIGSPDRFYSGEPVAQLREADARKYIHKDVLLRCQRGGTDRDRGYKRGCFCVLADLRHITHTKIANPCQQAMDGGEQIGRCVHLIEESHQTEPEPVS